MARYIFMEKNKDKFEKKDDKTVAKGEQKPRPRTKAEPVAIKEEPKA